MKKIWKTVITTMALVSCIACLMPSAVKAEETDAQSESGVMYITEDAQAKAEAEETAETVFELKKEDSIFVTGKTDNNWYSFVKDGQVAYVECTKVNNPGVNEELVEEMKTQAEVAVKDIDTTIRYREEAVKSKIWGGIIVFLVSGIFVVGIITTINKKKSS